MAVAVALLGVWLGGAFAWPGAPDERVQALATGDVSARTGAALALAREGGAETLLVPALADRDPNVRLLAARLLLRRSSTAALAAATAWLTTAGGRDRALGLVALRDARELSPEARHAAERALVDGDVPLRVRALELLAAHLEPGQTAPFLRALDDDDQGVRLRAVRALGAAREPRAGLALLARVADGDRQVRAEAVAALAAVGDQRAVPALLRLLSDVSGELRGEAASALGRLHAEAAVPALARVASRWPRDDLSRRALAALGEIATPPALDVLVAAAREPTGAADVHLAFALAGTRGLPALVRELAAGSTTSAALAATALGELGDRAATKPLVAALGRADAAAAAAAAALARLGDPAAVPALAAFDETRVDPRAGRRASLPVTTTPAEPPAPSSSKGVAALAASVTDRTEAPSVRAAAAWALSAVAEDRHAHEILAAATTDADPAVAANARAALAARGQPRRSAQADARLVAEDDTPLPARWARIAVGDIVVWTLSDLDGRVHVDGLPPGDVTLTVPSE